MIDLFQNKNFSVYRIYKGIDKPLNKKYHPYFIIPTCTQSSHGSTYHIFTDGIE